MLPENIKVLLDLGIGDGSITKQPNGNCSFTIVHSMKQAVYAKHKAELLRAHGFSVNENIYTATSGKNAGKQFYRVYARVNPAIKTAYKWLYNKGKKTLDKALFRQLDARTLAYWFMDDGSAKTTNYQKEDWGRRVYERRKVSSYMFATDGFTFEECRLMQNWLLEKFGIVSTLARNKSNYRVAISNIPSKDKFREIVEPYVIDSMHYKLDYPHTFVGIKYFLVYTGVAAEETERKGLIND